MSSRFSAGALRLKVIPQEKNKLSNDFLEAFPECSLLIPVLKTTIKKICHRACLRDIIGQSYPIAIDSYTDSNHARYLVGSGYILR